MLNQAVKAAITAVGSYVPKETLTNQDLERMVDTSDEWIQSRTGIVQRHIAKNPLHPTSYLAIEAAKNLFQKKNVDPTSIDLVLVATITPDMNIAATAPYVATQIGASNAFAFDLQAACSGFLYGMSVASAFIRSGQYKKILLIGADKMSSIVDYSDRKTCVIFGDGAGAVLMEKSTNEFGYENDFLRSDGSGREFLYMKSGGSLHPINATTFAEGGHYLKQEGRTVFKYAVQNMSLAAKEVMKKNNLTSESIDYLVPHQANQRILDVTRKNIGIEDKKVLMNIQKYGNTTAATLPLVLADYESTFKAGDKILFAAFGGGFTWGAAYLTWNYDQST